MGCFQDLHIRLIFCMANLGKYTSSKYTSSMVWSVINQRQLNKSFLGCIFFPASFLQFADKKNICFCAFVSMTLSTGRRACRDATMVGKLMGNSMARPCFDGFGDNLSPVTMSPTGVPYRMVESFEKTHGSCHVRVQHCLCSVVFFVTLACMSQEVTKWLGSMCYFTYL